jgi:superfamily II DNA or RNA helicase
MGFRTKLAKQHAAFKTPKVKRFTGRLDFLSPDIWDVTCRSHFRSPEILPPPVLRAPVSRNQVFPPSSTDISPDLCSSEQLSVVSTHDLPVFIAAATTTAVDVSNIAPLSVSANLLTPIGTPDPKGRNYAQPREQGLPFPDPEPRKSSGLKARTPKAYTEHKRPRGVLRYTAGIWDLIFPILKPPLDFSFPNQLDLPSELYPFQVEGIKKLVENTSFLLGDEMGTGKTVMATVALRILFHKAQVHRALVICPASTRSVWQKHLADWGGAQILFTDVSGSLEVRKQDWRYPAHVYVVSYDTFRHDVTGSKSPLTEDVLKAFDLVILDEIHYIRNPSSGRSKAMKRLKPTYRWGLSGTPMQNSQKDLEGVFSFIKPGLFHHKDSLSNGNVSGRIAPFFLRRLKKDVIDDLPEKIPEDLWLELDGGQRSAYEETLGYSRDSFASGRKILTKMHIFALLQKLMQICNFAPNEQTSPKLERLVDQIEEVIDNYKVVVFTNYIKQGVEKIRPRLAKYGLAEITGQTPVGSRAEQIAMFQNDPSVRVFLGTTRAAGEGITLTEGSYVFHFDQWWNPAVAWQAEDRVHRKGQRRQVNVYSYFMMETIEVRIREKLRQKGLLFDEVINSLSEDQIDASLTMEDWCDVLDLDVGLIRDRSSSAAAAVSRTVGEIYAQMSQIAPNQFEHFVARCLRNVGYTCQVTAQSHDGGVDIVASRPDLGGREVTAVQCKRKAEVGVETARELLGTMSSNQRIAKGLLVVSGRLTRGCHEFIAQHGNLSAIEGFELAKIAIEHGVELDVSDSIV